MLQDEDAAREVFAIFCEDFWRGLKDFRWSCSLRTWSYALARHALYRTESERGRRRRHLPLSQVPEVERGFIVAATTVQSFLSTGRQRHVERIRQSLDREQQMLLILRHDRGLGWTEIAHVLAASDEPVAVATLRKRYERLIRHLRELYKNAELTR